MFDLPEKCTIWNIAGNDGFGGNSWDGPHPADCRIAYSAQKFTDTNGDTLVSTAVLYAESDKLMINSKVLFSESAALTPPPESDDVRQLSATPSGTNLKKAWFS